MRTKTTGQLARISTFAYRALLLLYPPGFRQAYGGQMAQVFRTHCAVSLQQSGLRCFARVWAHALVDTLRSAIGEWLTALRDHGPTRRLPWAATRHVQLAVVAALVVVVIGFASVVNERPSPGMLIYGTPTPTPYQRAVTALQNSPFMAFTGTSVTQWLAAPQSGIMPPRTTLDVGVHRIYASWSMRDRTHFRVVLHIEEPAIESGTVTIVGDGDRVWTYDARANAASVVRLGTAAPGRQPATAPLFVAMVNAWTALLPEDVVPNPAQSISLLDRTIVEGARDGQSIRLVGHGRRFGDTTDIFMLRPLLTYTWTTCKPPSPSGCANPIQHNLPLGHATLWLDHNHPFMLQYAETGVPLRSRLGTQGFRFRVLAVTYGRGPSSVALRLRLPVRPERQSAWCDQCSMDDGWASWLARVFARFYHFLPPRNALRGQLSRLQVFTANDGYMEEPSGVDILYSSGRHHDYYHPRDIPQIYALGPYVYIQERVQVHGLPAGLRIGRPWQAGRCRVWTGAYGDGHHWLAFARGPISVFIYSNAMTELQLVGYVANQLCSAPK